VLSFDPLGRRGRSEPGRAGPDSDGIRALSPVCSGYGVEISEWPIATQVRVRIRT
jgi:hypothetical protein